MAQKNGSWWLLLAIVLLVVLLFSCFVSAFVGGVAGWLVARERTESIRYYGPFTPDNPWVVPEIPATPELPRLPESARPWQAEPLAAGALVLYVEPGSPADEAGLEKGDIIVAVDGTSVLEDNDLSDIISGYAPGDVINIEYREWRTGSLTATKAKLTSREDNPEAAYLGIDYRTLPVAPERYGR